MKNRDYSKITKKSELIGHAACILPKLWQQSRSLSNISRLRWSLAGKANMYYREKLDEVPNWEGEDLSGKKILIHFGFSGIGDVFFFSRFLADSRFKEADVTFFCTPITSGLMREQTHIIKEVVEEPYIVRQAEGDDNSPWVIRFPEEDFKSFIDDIDFSIYDYKSDILKLAYDLEVDAEKIDKSPHIFVKGESDVQVDASKLNVGICWGGNQFHHRDKLRSAPREKIESLFENNKTNFYSLQIKDNEGLEKYDNVFVSEFKDFTATAQLIKKLDLIISVDTAVLNLAGAMGKPVWLITQKADPIHNKIDFRWTCTDKGINTWFKNAKAIGLEKNWDETIEEVSEELVKLIINRISLGLQTDSVTH